MQLLTNIVWSAQDFADLDTVMDDARYTEVAELDVRADVRTREKNILRLDVKVRDIAVMQERKAQQQLTQDPHRLPLAQPFLNVHHPLQLTSGNSGTSSF